MSDVPEMVERVARSLVAVDLPCKVGGQTPDSMTQSLTEGWIPIWRLYVAQATAAIAAMREPTWPMITNARRVQLETESEDGWGEKGYFGRIWALMIDAAAMGKVGDQRRGE